MSEIQQSRARVLQLLRIMAHCGHELHRGATVLDFGCGGGHKLQALLSEGYEAFGCDVALREDLSKNLENTHHLHNSDRIRLIDLDDYRIPFDDSTFDVVISDQVFEHVQDYQVALDEIRRVTKGSGIGLHLFPSRYRLIEPHIGVPLACMIQSKWWLGLWAMLGFQPKTHGELSLQESVNKSHTFLKSRTNYLTKSTLRSCFDEYFDKVSFCEADFLLTSDNEFLKKTVARVPLSSKLLGPIYSALSTRVILTSGRDNPVTRAEKMRA
jgi:SAM-dependent methyltransferase